MKIDRRYRAAYVGIFDEILRSSAPGRYDEAALPSYTHSNPAMSWLFWRRLKVALGMQGRCKGKHVLDFGCGGGVTFRHLAARGLEVTGCDNENADLARAVATGLGVDVTLCETLNAVRDRRFDIVLALDVLEHVDDLGRCVDELLSVSRPGACWVISGPTENLWYRIGRALAGFSGDYHVSTVYDIEHTVAERGLACRELRALYWPVTLFRISRWSVPG